MKKSNNFVWYMDWEYMIKIEYVFKYFKIPEKLAILRQMDIQSTKFDEKKCFFQHFFLVVS